MCTLIIGASSNPDRMSNKVARMMIQMGKCVHMLGLRSGKIQDRDIDLGFPQYEDITTVTLYVNPQNQVQYYNYILGLKPQRIVFNPGTENNEFYSILAAKGIKFEEACTLVMLMSGQYYDD